VNPISCSCQRQLKLTHLSRKQEFATGEMGFSGQLQRSNPEPLMSALGQKQTLQSVRPMSALPPKADIG